MVYPMFERAQEFKPGTEHQFKSRLLCELADYETDHPKIAGIKKLQACRLLTPSPMLILSDQAFRQWQTGHCLTPEVTEAALEAYDYIHQRSPNRGVYIGRGFEVPGVENPMGHRTSGIKDQQTFLTELQTFYQKVEEIGYDKTPNAKFALVFHPFMHAGEPLMNENPPLLFPGGDVTPLGHDKFQIRVNFGADEGVQGYAHDTFNVRRTNTGFQISKKIGVKEIALLPTTRGYEPLAVPDVYQNQQTISDSTVLEIAAAALRVNERFSANRLEFITQPEDVVYRECQPFTLSEDQMINPDQPEIQAQTQRIESEEDIKRITINSPIIYLPASLFQKRAIGLFAQIAAHARTEGINLRILSYGDIATCHLTRVFSDFGFSVFFVGERDLKDQTPIKIFKVNGDGIAGWEVVEKPREMVASLNDPKIKEKDVGAKALNLYLLHEGGFLTPKGFAISTAMFRSYLSNLGLLPEINRLADLEGPDLKRALQNIREKIMAGKMPEEFTQAIVEKVTSLSSSLAVRSSANVEDGSVAAFAGQFESYIGISPAGVIETVKACWASTFGDGPILYARSQDIAAPDMEMGVVIQETVKSRKAGIIFTKSPSNYKFVITASSGVPSDVVENRASDMHQINIDRMTREISSVEQRPQDKPPVLTEKEIEQLQELGWGVEELFCHPQDIEWVMEENTGKIYLVQSRPI